MSLRDYKEGVKKFLTGLVPIAGEYQAYQEAKKYGLSDSPVGFVGLAGFRTAGLATAPLFLASNDPGNAALAGTILYGIPTILSEAESFRDFQDDGEDYNEFQNTEPDLEI